MDIVLWRIRIKAGKEALALEWLDFLTANQEAGSQTLKNEKEHLEIYFTNTENGAMYLYLFVLADDLAYASQIAASSENPLDAKHMAYMAACVEQEDCLPLSPSLAMGYFSVFAS